MFYLVSEWGEAKSEILTLPSTFYAGVNTQTLPNCHLRSANGQSEHRGSCAVAGISSSQSTQRNDVAAQPFPGYLMIDSAL